MKVPVAELLSPGYAKARAAEIKPDAITPKVAAGATAKQEPPSTTSLSVVDAQGNMVALPQTISDFFGAQGIVIDPKTGLRAGGADPRRDGAVAGY